MKNKYLIILLLTMFLVPFRVFASGSFNLSSTSLTIYSGESKTITISTNDSVGKLDISTSNGGVASVSTGSVFIETVGSSKTFTIKANNVGSATITVVGSDNYASFSDEKSLEGMKKTVQVNVIERPVDNRSKNNNLKSISVDGYELIKENNNNYSLTVSNDVTSINVNALAEDEKASVTGIGRHELNVGENNITVVITAENESKNNINVKVIRKDGYYLEDLESLLKNENINEIDIIISMDTKITNQILEQIKSYNKKVRFNYFNESKKLLYSWIIDGNKITDVNEILTTINYDSENKDKISSLSNYADGLYIDFSHEGKISNGTEIKLYIGDKFKNNDLVNIYHYGGDKLEIIKEKTTVVDGYIEMEIEHCSEYFITMSTLIKEEKNVEEETFDIYKIVSIAEVVIIVILIIIIIFRRKGKKKISVEAVKKSENIFETTNDIFPSDNNDGNSESNNQNINNDIPIINNVN